MRNVFVMLAFFLCACGGADSTPEPPAEAALAITDKDFTDAEGRLVCPVMGDVIESKERAVGQVEFKGTTYWFCCDSCQHMFNDDPERYADGRFLAHLNEEHDGRFTPCYHVL